MLFLSTINTFLLVATPNETRKLDATRLSSILAARNAAIVCSQFIPIQLSTLKNCTPTSTVAP